MYRLAHNNHGTDISVSLEEEAECFQTSQEFLIVEV